MATVHKLFNNPAEVALKAMTQYQMSILAEALGHTRAIYAIIQYGKALLEGRNEYSSNNAFSAWVAANKLDVGKPWDQRNERGAAMLIAELVAGKVPATAFDDCPHTVPTNIMKWYRAKHLASGDSPAPRTRAKSAADIRRVEELTDEGKTVKEIVKDTGINARTVYHHQELIRARRAAEVEAKAEVKSLLDIDPATLSPSAQAKLEAAKRAMERKLQAQYNERMRDVNEEIRLKVVAQGVEYVKSMEAMEAEARADQKHWRAMVNNHKPPFSSDEFKTILMCLHPDGTRTPEKLHEAFMLFNSKKTPLTGKRG